MCILQNQNDCPLSDHLQLERHKNKATHTIRILKIFSNKTMKTSSL
jgi:hypothetical protein